MLPDERTTTATSCRCPARPKGWSSRRARVAGPLVGFLRAQGINVRTADDADGAFEEALLHPPDVVLIDDRVPPAGGVDLCATAEGQRPHALRPDDHLRAQRSAAIPGARRWPRAPTRCSRPRPTRRSGARVCGRCCARARCTALERKQRTQGSEIVERRHWRRTSCTICRGQVAALPANVDYLARFAPAAGRPRRADFDESVEDARRGLRAAQGGACGPCMDYDRFETGQLVPRETRSRWASWRPRRSKAAPPRADAPG